ncbi:MAG: hypothetical protein JWQ04_2482 [Pedosphaera sp.]|nr:hypothetical protein [Pedosphaera sp.]
MFKHLDRKFLAVCVAALMAASCAHAYGPTENYETRQIEGWTIRVNKKLLNENAPLAKDVLQLLDQQLYQITRVVPGPALARLRDVAIWVELSDPLFPCMCYHPSGDWLREHDLNPEKAGGVELANGINFLTWTKEQPWMVLHELAHSYHHRVLGYDHPEIKAAYLRAVESKSYESVRHINGKLVRHYALNNDQEYFAESCEAYFGTNDFYPFVRAELQQHDPTIFALLERVWGTKPSPTPAKIELQSTQPVSTNAVR